MDNNGQYYDTDIYMDNTYDLTLCKCLEDIGIFRCFMIQRQGLCIDRWTMVCGAKVYFVHFLTVLSAVFGSETDLDSAIPLEPMPLEMSRGNNSVQVTFHAVETCAFHS